MRSLILLATTGLLTAGVTIGQAAERPDWAFPVTDKVQPPVKDDGQPKHAPGSSQSYTRKQIDDLYNAPDWYPELHPPMPQIVAHGNQANSVRACASCHLPTGTGHDESAYVAALPASYFVRQMADYKSGARKGSGTMTGIGKAITDEEVRAAADYFAALKPRPWIKVVETETVPKTYVGSGNKRLAHPDGGGREPIGNRIIEIPEDEQIVLNRDPRSGFVAYVPPGSIAKGEALVTTGGGKTQACAACHGADLKGMTINGMGDVPPIAGRQANYIVRQLFMLQNGDRAGPSAAPMLPAVEKLTVDDMLAIGAYTASRQP
jgi:cytochrome c553